MKKILKGRGILTVLLMAALWLSPLIILRGWANGELDQFIYLPLIFKPGTDSAATNEWTQHAFNAQRTSFNPQAIPEPWRWKWSWNGPDAQGRISAGKFGLPRNSQPITGGGKVYLSAGTRGVFALDRANGQPLWNFTVNGAAANSTPAYDPETQALFILFSNGVLYKLNSQTGTILSQYQSGASSALPLPPALTQDKVLFGIGANVYALDKQNLQLIWQYASGSEVHTPVAYSQRQNLVIVATQDLYVHAINASDGTRRWRVKPTPLQAGDPGNSAENNYAEVSRGWPVIAEEHGLVFIRYRLDWQTLWNWNPTNLSENQQMRAFLQNNPTEQPLFALKLTDGQSAFIPNVGNGGFGDGDYLPMGPLPVVKRFNDNREVAYVVMRGYPCLPGSPTCDGRGDSRLGELMLDDSTVAGYQSGYVRYMENTYFPTDEQAFLSMAGDQLFAAHWEAGIAHQILDRSSSKGSPNNPITVSNLPHLVTSQDEDLCNTGFRSSHDCASGLSNGRVWPGGFYIYWNQGAVYDRYWSEYAQWVISQDLILFTSTDGAIVALEHASSAQIIQSETKARVHPHRLVSERAAVIPPATISPEQAKEYAGQVVTVRGTLVEVFNNRKAVYLTFDKPHQGKFIVRILKESWENFPAPPQTLFHPGDTIAVSGKVEWYQGAAVIYPSSPDQIQKLP